jgi:riboflavin kinase / FMN adenylyltransferase
MDVFRDLEAVPEALAGRSLALGTFDGVHRGHRRVIGSALEWARRHEATATVVTFDPHPLHVLAPAEAPPLLTTTAVKIDLVSALGLDEVVVIPFTQELAGVAAEDFCRDVLTAALAAAHVSVGSNFRFGHGAAGDAELLRSCGGFDTEVVPLVEAGGEAVSSSRIRELVASGAVAEARELLEAPFQLDGRVVEGAARGRLLEMPTANLEPSPEVVVPAAGVYAGLARAEGDEYAAAVNVGVRPTFETEGETKIEAYLIGFEGDLYGRTVRLCFLERLRDEVRFESPEELVAQMKTDVEQTARIAGRESRIAD